MATENDLSRTLRGGHELCYDFECTLCERDGRHSEAAIYCEDCLVYMCDSCVIQHNKFPLHAGHQLLDQSQFTTMNKPAGVSIPTKRCSQHPGELINIFCGDHDDVCCSVCKAFEHSNCINTKHLPIAAKDVLKSQETASVKEETKALVSVLDQVILARETDLSNVDKEKQSVKEIIEEFRKKVKKYFDDLEKMSLDELRLKEKTIKDSIYQEKKNLEMAKSKAEGFLKQLESFKGENECDFFIQLKTGKQFVEMAMKKVKPLSKVQQKPLVHFEINTEIELYLSSLKYLGSFIDAAEDSFLSCPTESKVTEIQPSPKARNIELFGRFCVADASDIKVCGISSICMSSDGEVIVADSSNSKLKKLDKTYELVGSVNMPASVHSVCLKDINQAAASLYMKRIIQHVSTEPELSLKSSFSVGAYCRGMCCIGDKLLVCSGDVFQPNSGHIEVFDSAGHLRDTIPIAPQQLATVPLYITGSDDGEYLLVTSYKYDDITVLDLTGNVVTTFCHRDLQGPRGLCTDGRGHVYVCGSGSNTVVQLSLEHQKIDVLLTEEDGIKEPEGICFDRKTSRLLIGLSNSNDMYVYTLK